MKYVLWIALIVVLVWLLRPRNRPRSSNSQARTSSSAPREQTPEAMVSCSHCGLHVPASEALRSVSGALYCSNEHRKLHDER